MRSANRYRLCLALGAAGCATEAPTAPQALDVSALAQDSVVGYSQPFDLGTLPGGGMATAKAINESGVIVGYSTALTANGISNRAVRWSGTQILNLGVLPGRSASAAEDINRWGDVVGTSCDPCRAYRWNSISGMKALSWLGYAATEATGINDFGAVSGTGYLGSGESHAIKWTAAGKIVDLHPAHMIGSEASGISNDGTVVGRMWFLLDGYEYSISARWDSTGQLSVFGPLGYLYAGARDISPNNWIVGKNFNGHGFDAYIVDPQTLHFTPIPAIVGSLSGVNRHGRAVGESMYEAVVWDGGWAALPGVPHNGSHANAINDCGTVVGSIQDTVTNQSRAVRWSLRRCMR